MRTIELTYPHTLVLEELPKTVAAIGFFDGIHKGHQKVIQTAVTKAKESKMESAVITFHPHPSVVLKKETVHVEYITPLREKQEILQQMNVDRLYIITFSKKLASISPQEFIDHFIIGLNIQHVVAGFDFSYGHKGEGNMNIIHSHARGAFDYTIIEKVELENEKVSSTKIRSLLSKGDVEKVNEYLGRKLSVYGTVIEGDKRGRTIGFPTANMQVSSEALLPKIGVYAVKVLYKGEVYEGMANLGVKPTFKDNEKKPTLEVNIFDYSNDLYGEELQLEWCKFIRDEKKFNGVNELIEHIKMDEKQIRHYFSC
ncbi:bifunctional riboflavin kinase/FAD synthetase [Virgibacillus necropolis]|uniref:Riboflavin biosynthesis protein n=1 Tax=Virgibacillus necropolis TaxID=163877 RepID=A0A221MIG1_9BACI|nr:bifunctional riboflavin kinase/FAD synthetase [Virgibacillus necropolis]ASN07382.1 riboflavin biosynthesis protein RibF [Virgibacillus necropolis]